MRIVYLCIAVRDRGLGAGVQDGDGRPQAGRPARPHECHAATGRRCPRPTHQEAATAGTLSHWWDQTMWIDMDKIPIYTASGDRHVIYTMTG